MWRRAAIVAFLFAAAPLMASEGHAGGVHPALGNVLKALNLIVFFGLILYLLARPLRGFFEKHTEGIRSALDGSRAKEREAADLEAGARALASSIDGEAAALRARFAADRERVRRDLESATTRALARLRTDHEHALAQLELSFRTDLVAHTLRAARAEAEKSLQGSLTPADRARFLESVTAEGKGA